MNINEELQNLLADVFSVSLGVKNPRTDNPIKFDLKPGQNKYVYFRARGSNKEFCYTPHKDKNGWYYSWVYQPIGKGARTGKAKRWTLKVLVPHRTRTAARKRALRFLMAEQTRIANRNQSNG